MVVSVGVFAETVQPQAQGTIGIDLRVLPYAEIKVPTTPLEFTVNGKSGKDEDFLQVEIKSNAPIEVIVGSKGFSLNGGLFDLLNKAVLYTVNHTEEGETISFSAGKSNSRVYRQFAGTSEIYNVGFLLEYNPGSNWHEILAGGYRDTMIWTIRAVN